MTRRRGYKLNDKSEREIKIKKLRPAAFDKRI